MTAPVTARGACGLRNSGPSRWVCGWCELADGYHHRARCQRRCWFRCWAPYCSRGRSIVVWGSQACAPADATPEIHIRLHRGVAVLRRHCGASVCVDVAIRQSSWNGHGWRNCPSHLRNRGGGRSSPFTPTKPLKATAPFEAMESGKTRGRGYAVVALQLHAGAATSLTRRDSNGLQSHGTHTRIQASAVAFSEQKAPVDDHGYDRATLATRLLSRAGDFE